MEAGQRWWCGPERTQNPLVGADLPPSPHRPAPTTTILTLLPSRGKGREITERAECRYVPVRALAGVGDGLRSPGNLWRLSTHLACWEGLLVGHTPGRSLAMKLRHGEASPSVCLPAKTCCGCGQRLLHSGEDLKFRNHRTADGYIAACHITLVDFAGVSFGRGPFAKGRRHPGIRKQVGEVDPPRLRQIIATVRHVGKGLGVRLKRSGGQLSRHPPTLGT